MISLLIPRAAALSNLRSALRTASWAACGAAAYHSSPRPAAVTCCFSTAATATPTEDTLFSQGAPLVAYDGVVAASLGADRGRGLIARHSFEPGALVMSAQPAAVVDGEADEELDAELLVPVLMEAARQQPHVLAALNCLYDGTDSSRQQLPALSVLAMDRSSPAGHSCCPDHEHSHSHEHAHSHSHGAAAAAGGAGPGQLQGTGLTHERAQQLVQFNAFADTFEDLAAAAVRGAVMPRSHVGVWPAFSLFNHSCMPSANHLLVGHTMVVRATENVPAGQELTVSYQGRGDCAPAGARQAVLREQFGFDCDCRRCRLEQQAPAQLQQLVEDTYTLVQQELKPAFMEAVAQQDFSSLSRVHTALQEQEDRLSAALQEHLPAQETPNAVLVQQAAVYELYELLLFAEQLRPKGQPGSSTDAEVAHMTLARLGRCVAITSCVAPASELHVFLTCRMLQQAVDLRGSDSVQAEAAAALVQQAHLLRYGSAVSQQTLLGLMEANREAARDFLI